MKQHLFDIVGTEHKNRQALYCRIQGDGSYKSGAWHLESDTTMVGDTYFNMISLLKWRKYTDLAVLYLHGMAEEKIEVALWGANGEQREKISHHTCKGCFDIELPLVDFKYDFVFFEVCTSVKNILRNFSWQGSFGSWQPVNVGIVICTYKREDYLTRNVKKIHAYQVKHEWLSLLVVDNGSTLPEQQEEKFALVHNKNLGGSGGFARGMMEECQTGKNDYIILMDDDVDIELTAFERTRALLGGLKKEYKESFLAGAMLTMEAPAKQYENTAYWDFIRIKNLGKDYDLQEFAMLARNEMLPECQNQYAAWWYCCIPLRRIAEIGYPLPMFIKGDDMEFSIRNARPVISMNGIGVWHQSFASKQSDFVNYLADRNMLIINQYARGCDRWSLLAAMLGRLAKRCLLGQKNALYIFYMSLNDFYRGFEYIVDSEPKHIFDSLAGLQSKGRAKVLISTFALVLRCWLEYKPINERYHFFRKENLKNPAFWKKYLGLNGGG